MTFDTLCTIHETLKSEYNRIHKQLNAADSACKDAWRSKNILCWKNPQVKEPSQSDLPTKKK